tara:strand:- start:2439 stop:3440 length:1002 start_codon:yes stop_codon:yes gene_type:complete
MKEIPFKILFFIENSCSLITSLRAITSRFILEESIYPLENLIMKPIKNLDKYIEFVKDKNGDILYIEHPKKLLLEIEKKNYIKQWDRKTWYGWIRDVKKLIYNYPKLETLVDIYIKELDSVFEKSIFDIDYLCTTVKDLEPIMIKPFMFLYYELNSLSYEEMNVIDWDKMLRFHIDSISIIFSQIINEEKKEQICLEIFECVKILSMDISEIIQDETLLSSKIKTFKTEIFRILNTYSFYIDTTNINFKNWFLSLSHFFLHLSQVHFSLKKTIVKFNMILFLTPNTDELKTSTRVKYRSWSTTKPKLLNPQQLKYLVKIHPFIRNIHHDEIFS